MDVDPGLDQLGGHAVHRIDEGDPEQLLGSIDTERDGLVFLGGLGRNLGQGLGRDINHRQVHQRDSDSLLDHLGDPALGNQALLDQDVAQAPPALLVESQGALQVVVAQVTPLQQDGAQAAVP